MPSRIVWTTLRSPRIVRRLASPRRYSAADYRDRLYREIARRKKEAKVRVHPIAAIRTSFAALLIPAELSLCAWSCAADFYRASAYQPIHSAQPIMFCVQDARDRKAAAAAMASGGSSGSIPGPAASGAGGMPMSPGEAMAVSPGGYAGHR